jgi:hypothetical protein
MTAAWKGGHVYDFLRNNSSSTRYILNHNLSILILAASMPSK